MEKALTELDKLFKIRKENSLDTPLLAIGMSSRKNLCIQSRVLLDSKTPLMIDSKCQSLISEWSEDKCEYYENIASLKEGVYRLEDLIKFGKEKKTCPYFLSRRAFEYANIIICSYNYLLDPKISNIISNDLDPNTILVFDEGHNIDNVCISSLSLHINQNMIQNSIKNINSLHEIHQQFKKTSQERLEKEYLELKTGITKPTQNLITPGNIRKIDHFLSLLKRFCEFLKNHIQVDKPKNENPKLFVVNLEKDTQINISPLTFLTERLNSLFNTLQITNYYDYLPIKVICEFGTIVSRYKEGFHIVIEPYDERTPSEHDPILQLICLDPSIVMKPIFEHYNTVILTSGTLSPLDMFPKLLSFEPLVSISLTNTILRKNICPLILTRGNDQISVSTKYSVRIDPAIVRNYGSLIFEMSQVVPDGILVFFPSYQYMENLIRSWNTMGLLSNILKNKLLFIETSSALETSKSLNSYKKACDSGRGAIFLCVTRGKVSEGIDFDGHYGRCVIMIGIPFLNNKNMIISSRLKYMEEKNKIKPEEFELFDAMRQTAQCIGRVIRNKLDYGIMIFADKRFNNQDKRKQLPSWISQHITESNINLSTDTVVAKSQKFLKEMSQPIPKDLLKNLIKEFKE